MRIFPSIRLSESHYLADPILPSHVSKSAMLSAFTRETSKDMVTEAGLFRVTCRVNLLEGEVRYTAHEPLTFLGRHNSFKRDDGGWWGNVCERKLTDELDRRFEGTQERWDAVEAFYKANRDLARSLIVKAFPEAALGTNVMGAVVLPLNQLPESARAEMTAEIEQKAAWHKVA